MANAVNSKNGRVARRAVMDSTVVTRIRTAGERQKAKSPAWYGSWARRDG